MVDWTEQGVETSHHRICWIKFKEHFKTIGTPLPEILSDTETDKEVDILIRELLQDVTNSNQMTSDSFHQVHC